jgi:CheY-like chemotaxis protein
MTEAAAPVRLSLQGRHVLIVEDQFLIADEMSRVVVALGGKVVGPAPSLDATRRLLEKQTPDLALLDINLNGEQVWPVAHELRRRGVPLIFATGYEAADLPPAYRSEPHIGKPVNAKVLTAAVERLGPPPTREN